MSFFENTRKPVGLGGKIMVAMMNFGHSAMAAWGLQFLHSLPRMPWCWTAAAAVERTLKRC